MLSSGRLIDHPCTRAGRQRVLEELAGVVNVLLEYAE